MLKYIPFFKINGGKHESYKPLYENKVYIDSLTTMDHLTILLEALHPDIDEIVTIIGFAIINAIQKPSLLQKFKSNKVFVDVNGNRYTVKYQIRIGKLNKIIKDINTTLYVVDYENSPGFSGRYDPVKDELVVNFNLKKAKEIPTTLIHEITHMLDEKRYGNRVSSIIKSINKDMPVMIGKTYDEVKAEKLVGKLIAAYSDAEIQAYVHSFIMLILSDIENYKHVSGFYSYFERSHFLSIIIDTQRIINNYPVISNHYKLSKIARDGIRQLFLKLQREIKQNIPDEYQDSLLYDTRQYYNSVLSAEFK